MYGTAMAEQLKCNKRFMWMDVVRLRHELAELDNKCTDTGT